MRNSRIWRAAEALDVLTASGKRRERDREEPPHPTRLSSIGLASVGMSATAEPILHARGLTKSYKKTVALRGVDIDVAAGEVVGMLGPNGAGKSTLTKLLCGLVKADGGTATIGGSPAGSTPARSQVGYLAELFRFPGWATAEEVLATHQRLAHRPSGPGGRARALLAEVGLAQAAATRVEAMSKGMQQRLGLAQAMIGDPAVLLLDEPTSALDPAGRHTVREVLARARDRGTAVLLNTHLLGEVELLADRVVLIDAGKVVAAGFRRRADRRHRASRSRPTRAGSNTRVCSRRHPFDRRRPRRCRPIDLCRRTTPLDLGRPVPRARRRPRDPAMSDVLVIARLALQEAVRRRVLTVVGVLTLLSGGLYLMGCISLKHHVGGILDDGDDQADRARNAARAGVILDTLSRQRAVGLPHGECRAR